MMGGAVAVGGQNLGACGIGPALCCEGALPVDPPAADGAAEFALDVPDDEACAEPEDEGWGPDTGTRCC